MIVVQPSFEILAINGNLQLIEQAGRTCYKSEDRITDVSHIRFAENLISRDHLSVVEHASMTVRFVVDRGVSHELVRHRLASFSQESTRYCNYANEGHLEFIQPCFWPKTFWSYTMWEAHMIASENLYLHLIHEGMKPEEARSILPNSLKTEIVVTANLREWMHIFKMRASPKAHPQMREVMYPLLDEVKSRIPILFDKIKG